MPRQPSKKVKTVSRRKALGHSGQRTTGVASNAGGFISGPARVHIGAARLDMTEIVSERFEPKRCLDARGGRLICVAHDRVENREVALKVERKPAPVGNGHVTSLEREALMGFLTINQGRASVGSLDRYKAQLLAGDKTAFALESIVRSTGHRFGENLRKLQRLMVDHLRGK